MTFKAPDSLAEQIAHHLAERIIRGELKPGERIQEQKVTQALNVSRGSVREALLILERRHLVVILPRRGAQVTVLNAHNVTSLCNLMSELYILLANAVAERWQSEDDLAPFMHSQQRLQASFEQQDVRMFVEESFNVMRAAYPFANNLYLEETVENLQPSMSRSYFLALEQRKAEMSEYLALFGDMLAAVLARDLAQIRVVLTRYCQRSCQLVLSALEAS
ncbi:MULTISPECIES: GntR family transcriptional regulator [Pseudomonas syringae group]|uniref:GntR family transcriptional regulator n=3 Tax=Pseudomonas syringae group genomosp. 3 TaxID=251701 RepID=A0A0N8RF53_9PSED|nr:MULTISPECIES: GntR family transcriptional regulator [Pseudomonas syringae group]KPW45762.1 GntR family transcriptional regulator [Pseudomonas syringae pv. berberidis]KPX22231.1 GntR family transcriptional regulator [Pseudomonas syringae pv. delphinii]KPY19297.1 GntR family transcriptional regulator [Pseudomonas syringae pv. philadelphi]KPZ14307.1 GntR family transcriptional regulator [Pseudomonas syringae pv. viburni]RMM34640.1 GntR family transcriptional regulator [Pseudomonas syringae pv.